MKPAGEAGFRRKAVVPSESIPLPFTGNRYVLWRYRLGIASASVSFSEHCRSGKHLQRLKHNHLPPGIIYRSFCSVYSYYLYGRCLPLRRLVIIIHGVVVYPCRYTGTSRVNNISCEGSTEAVPNLGHCYCYTGRNRLRPGARRSLARVNSVTAVFILVMAISVLATGGFCKEADLQQ